MISYTIYTSTSRGELTLDVINEIADTSMKKNTQFGITGILLGIESKYLQYLEGEEREVQKLFEKIKLDPRHHQVNQWVKGYADDRVFSEWSMGSWMLTNDQLNGLSALEDLTKFMQDPNNSEIHSKKFIAMMHSLLKTWLAHEPKRMKKLNE